MPTHIDLKENTFLIDKYFPINIFYNASENHNILRTHWHDNIELIYVISGYAVFNVGSQSVSAVPEDIVIVNSGMLHSGYSVDNTQVDFYAIVFNKSLLASQAPDPFYIKYITPYLEGQHLYPSKIGFGDPKHLFFKEMITNIINEFYEKNSGYEVIIKSYLTLMTINVFRYYNTPAKVENYSNVYERNVENFKMLISYIEEHYYEKITIEQAAQIVNLSPFHFCKTFKKITGRTFIEFINLYRIDQAEKLLKSTKLPITQIAEKMGFCNINYFDRIFKQYKRYSPSLCRK